MSNSTSSTTCQSRSRLLGTLQVIHFRTLVCPRARAIMHLTLRLRPHSKRLLALRVPHGAFVSSTVAARRMRVRAVATHRQPSLHRSMPAFRSTRILCTALKAIIVRSSTANLMLRQRQI